MDRNYLVAAAVALAMAGCATSRVGPRSAELLEGDLRLLTHPPKCEVGVYVDDDKYILIDQEPVHVRGCATARDDPPPRNVMAALGGHPGNDQTLHFAS